MAKTYEEQCVIVESNNVKALLSEGTICTPLALIEEILDKLTIDWSNPSLKFLDPCCGRGVFLFCIKNRLINAGHDPKWVVENMLYGMDISEENVGVAVAIIGEGKYNCKLQVGNSLEYKWDMKFDVIVGNPPYQDATSVNTKNLWPIFVARSFSEYVKDGGYVALVTPRTWTTNEMYSDIFQKYQPVHLNVDECKRHFPGVGSTFSYFVLKACAPTDQPFVVQMANDKTTLTSLPSAGLGMTSATAVGIMQKVSTGTYFRVITSSGYNTMKFSKNDPTVSRTCDAAHPYPVLHKTLKKEGPIYFYSSLLDKTTHGVPRVVMNIWVANYRDMVASSDLLTCEQYRHFPAPTMKQSEVLKSVLQSKLYWFIALTSVSGGSFTTKSVSNFPTVDLTRSWTDAELYKHFNLTEDEIQLIEETVK